LLKEHATVFGWEARVKKTATMILAGAALWLGPLCAGPASAATTAPVAARDGHRDFDFLFGTWRTHYKLLRKRLSNNHDWYACEGHSVIRPFWNGSGNLEDGDLQCPSRYIGGMTLRLYNADTHQWSLYWGTRKLGLVPPAQVGHFDAHGVGEFFANDTYEGKPIVVRFKWTLGSGDHPHFEQAFSTDKGKTWETNWTTDYTRAH
ncbi:MAG TPA: hypothetical protein VKG44_08125, partial [Candidatus Baltobacteraceae bacterium]|nr:hypothetical protein [Candidatus Baltobacteraceae bacterium]